MVDFDSTHISLFKNVWSVNESESITILDVIWRISNGFWKDEVARYRKEEDKDKKAEIKKSIPAVTFAGEVTGKRFDSNINKYTQLVILDIDKISEDKLRSYKKKLKEDNHIVAYFESLSHGLKVLVSVTSDASKHKSHAFFQLEEYMLNRHNIVIDKSGKNLSRLCFISHDEDMYFNEFADDFKVDEEISYATSKSLERFFRPPKNARETHDSEKVFKLCIEWTNKSSIGSYRKGNRNNFVFALACHLNRAGMPIDLAIHKIFGRYNSLGFSEIENSVKSAYKHNEHEFGTKPIFENKRNQNTIF